MKIVIKFVFTLWQQLVVEVLSQRLLRREKGLCRLILLDTCCHPTLNRSLRSETDNNASELYGTIFLHTHGKL